MEKTTKLGIGICGISIGILFVMLWMPIYFAGPDGLEQATYDITGDSEYEPAPILNFTGFLFPDYSSPIFGEGYFQSWIVGVIGTAITFILMVGLLSIIRKKKSDRKILEEQSNGFTGTSQ